MLCYPCRFAYNLLALDIALNKPVSSLCVKISHNEVTNSGNSNLGHAPFATRKFIEGCYTKVIMNALNSTSIITLNPDAIYFFRFSTSRN